MMKDMSNLNYVKVPLSEAEDLNKPHTEWQNGKYVKIDEGDWVTYYTHHKIEKETITTHDDKQEEVNVCYAIPIRINKNQNIEDLKQLCSDDIYNDILPLYEKDNLESVKKYVINQLLIYDKSDNVNGFYINGEFGWLKKDERNSLTDLINKQRLKGINKTIFWFNNKQYRMNCNQLEQILTDLEIYAWECLNTTNEHKLNISKLTENISKYDYTANYPKQLTFEIK